MSSDECSRHAPDFGLRAPAPNIRQTDPPSDGDGASGRRWCEEFFDCATDWWGEPGITARDRARLDLVRTYVDSPSAAMLELGCGLGGSAVLAASDGFQVLGLDISGVRVTRARQLACLSSATIDARGGKVKFLHLDMFASVPVTERFDVVVFWNGFGVSSYDQDRRLLSIIQSRWTKEGGFFFVDIYLPWKWASIDGAIEEEGDLVCRTEFDAVESRFIETWWRADEPSETITQYGRCYTPPEIHSILESTGYEVIDLVADGLHRSRASRSEFSDALMQSYDITVVARTITSAERSTAIRN